MPEPQKFFVGLIDFFSIWLPGALLAYILRADLQPCLQALDFPVPTGTEAWIVFLLASYILGHFVFLLGAFVLDRWYDRLKDPITPKQAKEANEAIDRAAEYARANGRTPPIARSVAPSWRITLWLQRYLFKKDARDSLRKVCEIKQRDLGGIEAEHGVNAFQWAKARLVLDHPQAAEIVHRFEADSKFFRSLAVVLTFLFVWEPIAGRPGLMLPILLLLAGALWRFVDQRAKASSQAYWFVIVIDGERERRSAGAPVKQP